MLIFYTCNIYKNFLDYSSPKNLFIIKMKVKKVSQKNSSKEKKSVIAKRKKTDLSKLTTEEFFEQNFETDSDTCDDGKEEKNIGMI